MKFVSRISEINYVVRHSQIEYDSLGVPKPPSPPIEAKFHKHFFDTEVAEKQLRWTALSPSDEPHAVRIAVENYLLNHGDTNGGGLYVEGLAPKNALATPEELEQESGCIATISSPDGAIVICRATPVIREGFCLEHAALFLGDPEPEPSPEDSVPAVFQCPDCDHEPFGKAQGLRMHRMKVHPEPEPAGII